jgi:arabinose-5-phosphate isomerase
VKPKPERAPDPTVAEGRRVLEVEARAVAALASRLDERFTRAVDLLSAVQGKVVVTGMGKSGIVARKIAATMASTGTPAIYLHPAEGLHGDLGVVARGDLVLALSNSGETSELVSILPSLKRMAVPIIALVGRTDSTLGRTADVVLDGSVDQEACPLGLAPTASTTAALALGDAVAVALLVRKGFKEEDFALAHPGGALGRRLLMHVRDAMHTGGEMPKVSPDTPMRAAIVEISRKRLGITTVVDGGGRLLGVISDGDLRRQLESGADFLDTPAGKIMRPDPKTITPDALAAEAVERMERHSITSLVVVEGGAPVGLVHLHDLLKLGIA